MWRGFSTFRRNTFRGYLTQHIPTSAVGRSCAFFQPWVSHSSAELLRQDIQRLLVAVVIRLNEAPFAYQIFVFSHA